MCDPLHLTTLQTSPYLPSSLLSTTVSPCPFSCFLYSFFFCSLALLSRSSTRFVNPLERAAEDSFSFARIIARAGLSGLQETPSYKTRNFLTSRSVFICLVPTLVGTLCRSVCSCLQQFLLAQTATPEPFSTASWCVISLQSLAKLKQCYYTPRHVDCKPVVPKSLHMTQLRIANQTDSIEMSVPQAFSLAKPLILSGTNHSFTTCRNKDKDSCSMTLSIDRLSGPVVRVRGC
jgi:hypothetical protein